MQNNSQQQAQEARIAIVTIGSGDYLGSTVRDLALANALHRRGYTVCVYWMMEINRELADPGIEHRMLCHGTRYHFQRPSEVLDRVVGKALFLLPKKYRVRAIQKRAGYVDQLLANLIRSLYAAPRADPRLAQRLRRYLDADSISHVMMSFASLGPLILAAQQAGTRPFHYFVTFQGDEEFAAHAQRMGLLEPFQRRLNGALKGSPASGVVVSADYLARVSEEIGIAPACLHVIHNGIELPKTAASQRKPHFDALRGLFPALREDIPIVLYLGRQDTEKGIDLLFYAARQLAGQHIAMQLVICGSTAKGISYRQVLTELGQHLGLSVHHTGSVSPAIRDALYSLAYCVVYPSVNREPFGLVVAEAMSHGTPVIVPDYGGVGEVIQTGTRAGGLTFRTWDSGDLACQLGRLLTDPQLYARLAGDTRAMAARFDVEIMTDEILVHMGLRDLRGGKLLPQPDAAHIEERLRATLSVAGSASAS